jgi:membrane protease YdiL (CAAX protease family)
VTTPYIASTAGKRIGLALLGLLLYFTAQFAGAFLFGSGLDFTLALFGAHLVACAAIGGLYLLLRRNPLAGHAFRGVNFSYKALWLGLTSVVVVYLLAYNYAVLVDQPAEPFMLQFMTLLGAGSLADRVLLTSMVIVLAPLGEELAFRHFLLNLFPFRKPLWAVVAIVVSALAFAAIHLQVDRGAVVHPRPDAGLCADPNRRPAGAHGDACLRLDPGTGDVPAVLSVSPHGGW